MTLLPLPWVWGMTKKGIRAQFLNLGMRHPLKSKYELNHASKLPTLGVTKSNAKKVYLEGNSRDK